MDANRPPQQPGQEARKALGEVSPRKGEATPTPSLADDMRRLRLLGGATPTLTSSPTLRQALAAADKDAAAYSRAQEEIKRRIVSGGNPMTRAMRSTAAEREYQDNVAAAEAKNRAAQQEYKAKLKAYEEQKAAARAEQARQLKAYDARMKSRRAAAYEGETVPTAGVFAGDERIFKAEDDAYKKQKVQQPCGIALLIVLCEIAGIKRHTRRAGI